MNLQKAALVCAVAAVALLPAEAQDLSKRARRGFVDGSAFASLGGEGAGTVEVALDGMLLQTLMNVDPELKKLAGGLESIRAVILDLSEEGNDSLKVKARDLVLRTEKQLLGQGWSRIAKIRDDGSDISVLVLSGETTIGGLVVLGAGDDGEVIFANIAGEIDLAAISKLGETFEIPGLDQLDEDGD